MTKQAKPIGQVGQSEIDDWKRKYKTRRINTVIVKDEDGNSHITYFRQPEFEHLGLLTKKAKNDEELDALKTITTTLRIGGSDEVMSDYHMCFATVQSVGELLKAVKGSLGKL